MRSEEDKQMQEKVDHPRRNKRAACMQLLRASGSTQDSDVLNHEKTYIY
jgi:hypothetical protein